MEKIKPTNEQQKVIDKIKEFIKSPDKELLSPENVLMISGAGGTGKTFSITRAARQLQKEKYVSIAFSAPTHNAKCKFHGYLIILLVLLLVFYLFG